MHLDDHVVHLIQLLLGRLYNKVGPLFDYVKVIVGHESSDLNYDVFFRV